MIIATSTIVNKSRIILDGVILPFLLIVEVIGGVQVLGVEVVGVKVVGVQVVGFSCFCIVSLFLLDVGDIHSQTSTFLQVHSIH